ncbi:indole-3-glycerol phosphate synthase [Chloroflexota bacterium]|nr:indole-3-glycerol phosphate synthase [Chloroflexota bacterium]
MPWQEALGWLQSSRCITLASWRRALRIKPNSNRKINNRDLKTFQVSTATTIQLAAHIPAGVVIVAESGILQAADVRRMGAAGAHAVLVGEGCCRRRTLRRVCASSAASHGW